MTPASRALSSRVADRVTLGVQAAVFDEQRRVLLVRHGYRPGWHFPGGGVERGEPLALSLERELREETGIVAIRQPSLFGVYAHFDVFPGDHIVLFLIHHWRRDFVPKPNSEIAEQGFFGIQSMPSGVADGTRRRLAEVIEYLRPSPHW